MPLLALSCNLGWEIVYALFIAELGLDRFAFSSWLLIDVFVVYGFLKYGRDEWDGYFSFVGTYLGSVLVVATAWWGFVQWAFARIWLDGGWNEKGGKWYGGVEGPDLTELGFWAAGLAQLVLSWACLGQLGIRGHSGGVSWSIWSTRFFGTVIGFYSYYGFMWYMWREAHGYFVSPLGVVLWMTSLVVDLVYAVLLFQVKRGERVLEDGRKDARDWKENKIGEKNL